MNDYDDEGQAALHVAADKGLTEAISILTGGGWCERGCVGKYVIGYVLVKCIRKKCFRGGGQQVNQALDGRSGGGGGGVAKEVWDSCRVWGSYWGLGTEFMIQSIWKKHTSWQAAVCLMGGRGVQ